MFLYANYMQMMDYAGKLYQTYNIYLVNTKKQIKRI